MTKADQIRSEHHHGSHRGLLDFAPETSSLAQVDAIIVPTIRAPRAMQHAISRAAALNCVLVALCSRKHTSALSVAVRAAAAGVEVLAIDVENLPSGLLPVFKTCTQLNDPKFRRRSDLSLKRNLGLLIAWTAGWERIVFLDDDIEVPDPLDLSRAAALTDDYAGVGLKIEGYPDNSVVCHAYREAGGAQDAFVGGGALAVHTGSTPSFFPNIYNEDWFFLLGGETLRPTTVAGVAVQSPYDPFDVDERARTEELGDVLAEGLFWLLDEGRSLREANCAYWDQYLTKRRNFILETITMTRHTEKDAKRKIKKVNSLMAALGRSRYIQAEWCEAYIRAWRDDRDVWQNHLEHRHRQNFCKGDIGKVIARLGLAFQSTYL